MQCRHVVLVGRVEIGYVGGIERRNEGGEQGGEGGEADGDGESGAVEGVGAGCVGREGGICGGPGVAEGWVGQVCVIEGRPFG